MTVGAIIDIESSNQGRKDYYKSRQVSLFPPANNYSDFRDERGTESVFRVHRESSVCLDLVDIYALNHRLKYLFSVKVGVFNLNFEWHSYLKLIEFNLGR